MTNALERAYASNEQTPIHTIEIFHSSISTLRLAQSFTNIDATLEDASTVTFIAAAIAISLPSKNSDGSQDLDIQINNIDNAVWSYIKTIVSANRTSSEVIVCKYRPFLLSDLSAPAYAPLILNVKQSSINRLTASIRCSYSPIPVSSFPRHRYYASTFPGVLYA